MISANFFKAIRGAAFAALTVIAVLGCGSLPAKPVNNRPFPAAQAEGPVSSILEPVSLPEIAPCRALLIDGIPYPPEQVEELAALWNEALDKASRTFETDFRAALKAYTGYLSGQSATPSPNSPQARAFLEGFSALTAGYYTGLSSIRSLIRARLEAGVIDDRVPYEVIGTVRFDDLFQDIPLTTIEGNPYPAIAINIMRESMIETSMTQWALLRGELERTLTRMYSARKANSEDFAKWVHGWGNFFFKSWKELFGAWADEYAEQYNTRINRGIDTELPKRQVKQYKDRADILLSGYINALAQSGIPANGEDTGAASVPGMDYGEFFAPYTLLQNVYSAGELLGIDISGWQKETNNRLGGFIGVVFDIADVAGIVASKFNPIVVGIEAVIALFKGVWHLFTKDGKAAELQAEIGRALDTELSQLLAALRSITAGQGVRLAGAEG